MSENTDFESQAASSLNFSPGLALSLLVTQLSRMKDGDKNDICLLGLL